MKYICEVCGWIYDEESGDPENGIALEQNTRIFQKILSVLCVE